MLLDNHIAKLKSSGGRVSGHSAAASGDRFNIDVKVGDVSARAHDDKGAGVTIILASLLSEVLKKTPQVQLKKLDKQV